VEPGGADIAEEGGGNAIRELADRLVEEAARASEFRVRLELSERAQSTLEEQLAEERRGREETERELEELRRQLQALRETPEASETVEEEPEGAEPRPSTEDRQEPPEAFGSRGSGTARGSLWRRIFGR
jgi:plasmid stabilization system protein ParE